MSGTFFSKLLPVITGEWYNQTDHRQQCNMTHAYFALDHYGYRHTLIIRNTSRFSTTIMINSNAPQYYSILHRLFVKFYSGELQASAALSDVFLKSVKFAHTEHSSTTTSWLFIGDALKVFR
jgi:hypothetical protein